VGQGEVTASRADKSQVRGERGRSAASEGTASKEARRARERDRASEGGRRETREEAHELSHEW
jgi:hypothetical protein